MSLIVRDDACFISHYKIQNIKCREWDGCHLFLCVAYSMGPHPKLQFWIFLFPSFTLLFEFYLRLWYKIATAGSVRNNDNCIQVVHSIWECARKRPCHLGVVDFITSDLHCRFYILDFCILRMHIRKRGHAVLSCDIRFMKGTRHAPAGLRPLFPMS